MYQIELLDKSGNVFCIVGVDNSTGKEVLTSVKTENHYKYLLN